MMGQRSAGVGITSRWGRQLWLPVIFALTLTGCFTRQVQSGLSQQTAQEIAVILKDNGISASIQQQADKKEGDNWEVVVRGGPDTAVSAWKILHENGFSRDRAKGLEEVYANSGMIPTAAEEKARLLVGLSGELSRTLKSINDVVDARVHVVLPENNSLVDKSQQTPTTASVLVKYQGALPPVKPEEVKSLISKGIENLSPENISVVMKQVRVKPVEKSIVDIVLDGLVMIGLAILAAIAGFGALGMMGRVRLQRAKIQSLERELASLSGMAKG